MSSCRASTSFTASSPVKPNMQGSTSQKNASRASEWDLQGTLFVTENDADRHARERAVAQISLLGHHSKRRTRLPRKWPLVRATEYVFPPSPLSKVTKPKPLSTVVEQADTTETHTRDSTIGNAQSKTGELSVANERKTNFSQHESSPPRATAPPVKPLHLPGAELSNASVGTPVTKVSPNILSLNVKDNEKSRGVQLFDSGGHLPNDKMMWEPNFFSR
ncbi:protein ELYS-like [Podargus strigoides]